MSAMSRYKCPLCDYGANRREDIAWHLRGDPHNVFVTSANYGSPTYWHCPCGFSSGRGAQAMAEHMASLRTRRAIAAHFAAGALQMSAWDVDPQG